ncbi:MAG TPA: SCO family protein [Steroidobacteraceae bacterium]|nr:SCO family protein [Steroidobacteraceae bacterium]
MRHVPVWSAILFAVAVGAGIALVQRSAEPPTLGAGTALPEPRELPDFALVDQAGRPFDGKRLEGRWSLLFTGFTHCPDVCPTTVALMADLNRRVARQDVQFVFVSVDPERDTPEVVASYLAHFDPALVGATGARAEMERLTAGLGLGQVRNPGAGDEYTVDHATAFVLIDPDARLAGYFSAPHDRDALAADLSRLPKGDVHL